MSDDVLEAFWYCASVDSFHRVVRSSRGDKVYNVRYDSLNHKYTDETTHDWSCTCPSYEYHCGPHRKKRYCKHIEKVRESEYCGWQQFHQQGIPDYDEHDMPHCPQCGRIAKAKMYL